MTEQIRRVAVWSGWLRLAHWTLAGATLLLLATGWLVANAPNVANTAGDVHYLGASLLIFALALRVVLGFLGKGAERFEHLLPRESEWAGIRTSLLFYLSLGRSPLPNWFAHNPLWKPLYLLLYALLVLLTLSGWLMPDRPLTWGLYLPQVHEGLASAVAILLVLHLYAVIIQDMKGDNADVSAMINGHRYFGIDSGPLIKPDVPQISVDVDELTPPEGSKRDD